MKLLFYSFCEPDDPSTKFRCYMMARELAQYGIEADVLAGRPRESLTTNLAHAVASLKKYDIVVFHRHGSIPAYLALSIAKAQGKKIILDFDDALFTFGQHGVESAHRTLNKWFGYPAFAAMVRSVDAVTAGSHYLKEYADQLNSKVFLLPTAIDTNIFKPMPKERNNSIFTIGWVGNAPNHINNLRLLVEPLARLSQHNQIRFSIISALGDIKVKALFPSQNGLSVDYGLDRMVDASLVPKLMSSFDIGVCPLEDNPFFKGSCACKLLTCMAMSIPVVASPVGEHNYIILPGINGFLAKSIEEWVLAIKALMDNPTLRANMGFKGLETVSNGYTLAQQAKRFAEICYGL